jgi:hypothetical protein
VVREKLIIDYKKVKSSIITITIDKNLHSNDKYFESLQVIMENILKLFEFSIQEIQNLYEKDNFFRFKKSPEFFEMVKYFKNKKL